MWRSFSIYHHPPWAYLPLIILLTASRCSFFLVSMQFYIISFLYQNIIVIHIKVLCYKIFFNFFNCMMSWIDWVVFCLLITCAQHLSILIIIFERCCLLPTNVENSSCISLYLYFICIFVFVVYLLPTQTLIFWYNA